MQRTDPEKLEELDFMLEAPIIGRRTMTQSKLRSSVADDTAAFLATGASLHSEG